MNLGMLVNLYGKVAEASIRKDLKKLFNFLILAYNFTIIFSCTKS